MTAPISPKTLRDLCLKATPGEWETESDDSVIITADGTYVAGDPDGYMSEDDVRLIVAMHNALPGLLDRLSAAEAVVEAARHALPNIASDVMASVKRDLREALAAYDTAAKAKGAGE